MPVLPRVPPSDLLLERLVIQCRLHAKSLLPLHSAGNSIMWRAIFIAVGIMAIVLGFECLVIDSADIYAAGETKASSFWNPSQTPSVHTREVRPQEWFPYAVLSAGMITILYAFTLPKRFGGPAAG